MVAAYGGKSVAFILVYVVYRTTNGTEQFSSERVHLVVYVARSTKFDDLNRRYG